MRIEHPIPPLYDKSSEILILGSFPSVKSREQAFFYAHPQNRFWRVISVLLESTLPISVEEKKQLLLKSKIAVWDVISACDIVGSSDNSIKNVVPNDLSIILNYAPIEKIFVNGRTAHKYYDKYTKDKIGIEAICLPSTSPANATWTLDRLVDAWKIIKNN